MVTMFVQNDMKNPNTKQLTCSESRDIDENQILQWLCWMFCIIHQLAAEWCWIPFYDVIRNMAGSNRRWRQKEDDKWHCVIGIDFIMICECVRSCKFYPKLCLASGFTLTKSTRTVSLQDPPLLNVTSGRPYATAEVTILVRKYLENYQK